MFDNIMKFFKKFVKEEKKDSKDTAKERLHLVLMQDRANVSADFMELMKQEIIEVIKKYIDVDENSIDVKLTNKVNNDGTTGVPMLYANIPIVNVKDDAKQVKVEREVPKKEEEASKEKIGEEVAENTKKEELKKEEIKETVEKVETEKVKEETESEALKQSKEEKETQETKNEEKDSNKEEKIEKK